VRAILISQCKAAINTECRVDTDAEGIPLQSSPAGKTPSQRNSENRRGAFELIRDDRAEQEMHTRHPCMCKRNAILRVIISTHRVWAWARCTMAEPAAVPAPVAAAIPEGPYISAWPAVVREPIAQAIAQIAREAPDVEVLTSSWVRLHFPNLDIPTDNSPHVIH